MQRFFLTAWCWVSVVVCAAAQPVGDDPALSPIDGAVVLLAGDEVPAGVVRAVRQLSGDSDRSLVLLSRDGDVRSQLDWIGLDLTRVASIAWDGPDVWQDRTTLAAMLEATVVWIEDDVFTRTDWEILQALLDSVLARGGVVGVQGEGAVFAQMLGESLSGASLALGGGDDAGRGTATFGGGLVSVSVPDGVALVLYDGRRLAAVGEGAVTLSVPAANDWPARVMEIEASGMDVSDASLGYDADWLSWVRSARDRAGPVFPAAEAATPVVEEGTLLIFGGRRTTDDMWEAFIEAAGGRDAAFVCVPTASTTDERFEGDDYGAENLRERGCTNVRVLHTTSRTRAEDDPMFFRVLAGADGVWIGGGRTYRLADAYGGTRIESLLRGVLDRGGAVAGSSAGAQVIGELLVRGDPRDNVEPMLFEGYTRGFGLLEGVVVDAHFSQRDRQGPFYEGVMRVHPQLLGIGVDENTGLVVRGSVGEVIGEAAVVFYADAPDEQGVVLRAGEAYDLAARERVVLAELDSVHE